MSAGLLLTALAGPAAAVCDAYSGNCTPTPSTSPSPPASVLPTTADRDEPTDEGGTADTASDAATLPFTGGELVLLTAVGAGALAGGTALVVAGRHRKPDAV